MSILQLTALSECNLPISRACCSHSEEPLRWNRRVKTYVDGELAVIEYYNGDKFLFRQDMGLDVTFVIDDFTGEFLEDIDGNLIIDG